MLDGFNFRRLEITGIDNEPVFALNVPSAREQEVCLFHNTVAGGDDYVRRLAERIENAMRSRTALPVVRFADGEYAFYNLSLLCNGLYQQAESVAAIRAALPSHVVALRAVAEQGILAPLVFPGNVRRRPWWRRKSGDDSGRRFLDFLAHNGVPLTAQNYVPFYAVYACLSDVSFAKMLDGKTVCVVNSDYDAAACADWFARAGARPRLTHARIPASYVATQWEPALAAVKEPADLFLVGAGVGALPVCVDVARRFGAPAIDAGHILNMMNNLERKSQGPRFYTHRR
jgi:hypothetical protein